MSKNSKTFKEQFVEELPVNDYINVVSLAGMPQPEPQPEGLAGARIIAHQNERINALVDLVARQTQQLQDELDYAEERGEERPELQALLDESEQLLDAV